MTRFEHSINKITQDSIEIFYRVVNGERVSEAELELNSGYLIILDVILECLILGWSEEVVDIVIEEMAKRLPSDDFTNLHLQAAKDVWLKYFRSAQYQENDMYFENLHTRICSNISDQFKTRLHETIYKYLRVINSLDKKHIIVDMVPGLKIFQDFMIELSFHNTNPSLYKPSLQEIYRKILSCNGEDPFLIDINTPIRKLIFEVIQGVLNAKEN